MRFMAKRKGIPMTLRLSLALTVHREVDVIVSDTMPPGRLNELARVVALQMGTFDVVTIRSVEELPDWEPRQAANGNG